MPNLAKQIENLTIEMANQLPKEALEIFARSIADLKTANIEEQAIKTGMTLPAFNLANTESEIIKSDELLKDYEKVILCFFRGSWCPYCNLELRALQDKIRAKNLKNIRILAISPQIQSQSLELKQNLDLDFDLLFDHNNEYAEKLGIAFKLPDYVLSTYSDLGIDLTKFNDNNNNELPIPAVFVVDQNAIITYSFVDSNYMNRIDLDALIIAL